MVISSKSQFLYEIINSLRIEQDRDILGKTAMGSRHSPLSLSIYWSIYWSQMKYWIKQPIEASGAISLGPLSRFTVLPKFAISQSEANSTVLISYDIKSLTWYPSISWSLSSKVMLPYDKLQRGFANKQTTRNLRFSWCFAVKKGAKTFPPKLNWKTLANCVDKYRFRLKQWSRSYQIFRSIWILEISKMKLQTNELKRCQKRTLIKVLKTRKVSIQYNI